MYTLYTRRWFIMLSVIFLNMAGYMFTIGFAPVANSAATYYNVTGDMVDMFPLVGMGANVPGLFAALFCIDKFGIKVVFPVDQVSRVDFDKLYAENRDYIL